MKAGWNRQKQWIREAAYYILATFIAFVLAMFVAVTSILIGRALRMIFYP
jgi:hypothetical protein